MNDNGARFFVLIRHEDVSGVSGTGVVAVGARFPTGRCVLEWLPSPGVNVRSMGFYQSIEEVQAVHGHGGKTTVEWPDGSIAAPIRGGCSGKWEGGDVACDPFTPPEGLCRRCRNIEFPEKIGEGFVRQ